MGDDSMPVQIAGLSMGSTSMAYGLAPTLGPSGIQMDVSKAMSILGFSSSQTFQSTDMESIKDAYTYRMNNLLKAQQKQRGYNARKQDSRKTEIRRLNEALQFLTRKRNKSEKNLEEFRARSNRQVLMTRTIEALTLDESMAYKRTDEYKEEQKRKELLKKTESKRAQALADELIQSIESKDAATAPPEEKQSSLKHKDSRKGRTATLDLVAASSEEKEPRKKSDPNQTLNISTRSTRRRASAHAMQKYRPSEPKVKEKKKKETVEIPDVNLEEATEPVFTIQELDAIQGAVLQQSFYR